MSSIKQLRKEAKVTQADLAKKVGVTQPAVSGWDRGVPVPDPLLVRVAEALGCDLSLLHSEAEQPDPQPRRRRRQRTHRPQPGVCFVQVLTHYRSRAGLSVEDLARRSGVPETIIRHVEAGRVPLDADDAADLARVLACQATHLSTAEPGPVVSGGGLVEAYDLCGRPIAGQGVTEADRQEALWQLGLRDTPPAPATLKPKAKPDPVRYPDSAEVGRYRRALGLSQAELADRAGISQPAISAIESGGAPVPRVVWTALAREFGVHPSKLGAGEWSAVV
jgi:transcriptional regulator with XRE-family HTH domain